MAKLTPAAALAALSLSVGLASCGVGGGQAAPPTTTPASSTTTTRPTTTTTAHLGQSGGSRTVLSPIGVNVRAKPSLSAKVIATAAQGVVLTVLGHTDVGGGWFKVRGATVTGWMTDNASLTAAGKFSTYNAGQYGLLYPSGWAVHRVKSSTVFRSPTATGPEVVVSTATSVAKLPQLRPGVAGVAETGSRHVLACGVTSYLDTFTSAKQQVEQVLLPLDTHHALGLQGYLHRPSQKQVFLDIVNSVWFPFPQCVGGSPATTTTHSAHKAH
jgi:uncharacterized protein YgiM (DUF1202 family)